MVQLQQSVPLSKAAPSRRIKLWLLIQCLVSVPVLIGLGVWQLDRADQKALLLMQWQNAPLREFGRSLQRFDRVQVSGTLDTQRYLLLDNRIRKGVAGYEVVGLFRPDVMDSRYPMMLIVLGWVEANVDRQVLPEIELPERLEAIAARLDLPSNPLVLADQQWQGLWPERVQQLDVTDISRQLGEPLSEWLIRPEQSPLNGEISNWTPVVMPPEKHLGYAVQWFALALAWGVMTGWLTVRTLPARKEDEV